MSGRLFCCSVRDWPQSDKPSRQEAATSATWMSSLGRRCQDGELSQTTLVHPLRRLVWQSGVPFFYPSIEPMVGSERREAAPSIDEHEAQWHEELASQPEA